MNFGESIGLTGKQKEALAWAAFIYWNSKFKQVEARGHTFHEVMDVANLHTGGAVRYDMDAQNPYDVGYGAKQKNKRTWTAPVTKTETDFVLGTMTIPANTIGNLRHHLDMSAGFTVAELEGMTGHDMYSLAAELNKKPEVVAQAREAALDKMMKVKFTCGVTLYRRDIEDLRDEGILDDYFDMDEVEAILKDEDGTEAAHIVALALLVKVEPSRLAKSFKTLLKVYQKQERQKQKALKKQQKQEKARKKLEKLKKKAGNSNPIEKQLIVPQAPPKLQAYMNVVGGLGYYPLPIFTPSEITAFAEWSKEPGFSKITLHEDGSDLHYYAKTSELNSFMGVSSSKTSSEDEVQGKEKEIEKDKGKSIVEPKKQAFIASKLSKSQIQELVKAMYSGRSFENYFTLEEMRILAEPGSTNQELAALAGLLGDDKEFVRQDLNKSIKKAESLSAPTITKPPSIQSPPRKQEPKKELPPTPQVSNVKSGGDEGHGGLQVRGVYKVISGFEVDSLYRNSPSKVPPGSDLMVVSINSDEVEIEAVVDKQTPSHQRGYHNSNVRGTVSLSVLSPAIGLG